MIDERTDNYSSRGYSFTYIAMEGEEGKLNGFSLQARPIKYPFSGIRSYFVEVPFPQVPNDGRYHGWEHPALTVQATSEDRDATPSDPGGTQMRV